MKNTKDTITFGLTVAWLAALLSAGNVSAQILRVDSVTVDSVWNSDSSWYDGNGIAQQRTSRDCRIGFVLHGEGKARIFVALSIDSGKSWAPSPDPLSVSSDAFSSTFVTGLKTTITVRVLGGDRSGVAFKVTARQSAPTVKGNPRFYVLNLVSTPSAGENVSAVLRATAGAEPSDSNGFCVIDKVYWDALGDGTIDDSTKAQNEFTWTWQLQVPSGVAWQRRGVIVRAKDLNGLISAPETLTVQFGMQRMQTMKIIPAGTFTMGSDDVSRNYYASPLHQVNLSAFKIQETEVTQEQYLAVMGTNPSFCTGNLLRPVESVNWCDAARYCNALSKRLGLDPVYDTANWTADLGRDGYRLPSEAQWEYACRATTTTDFYWGQQNDSSTICQYSWQSFNTPEATQSVGQKMPNLWGLYDMSGNVFEFCGDWFVGYGNALVTDPVGPPAGTYRVSRGGAWGGDIDFLASACRYSCPPDYADRSYGFRVVLPAN